MELVTGWKELKIVVLVANSIETLTYYITKLELETNESGTAKSYWLDLNCGSNTYIKININTTIAQLAQCYWFGSDVTSTTKVYYFIRK